MNVYLSYAKSDRDSAKEIASYLKAERGMDVWLSGEQLLPGDNWAAKVGSVLEDADAMIVLLSPDSMKSEWVRHDIEYALGTSHFKGRFIPVMIKPTSDIPWILERFQVLQGKGQSKETAKDILKVLKVKIASPKTRQAR